MTQTDTKQLFQYIPSAWLVLVITLVITGASWWLVDKANHHQAENQFQYQVNKIRNAVSNHMVAYQQVLAGGVGLFAASQTVSRMEWRTYVDKLNTQTYYPGIQGLGFSLLIPPEKLDAHIAEIRAEGGWFSQYRIKPPGERAIYTSIIYLEPLDERNRQAIGYDMFAEAVRRVAMTRARDSGEVALSGKVVLVQEIDNDVQAGFLAYAPFYRQNLPTDTVEQRRQALVGYVYGVFRCRDLMEAIANVHQGGIDFHIYDGGARENLNEARLMYGGVPDHDDSQRAAYQHIDTLNIAGHTWTLLFKSLPEFKQNTRSYTARLVLFGGIVFSILLFFMIRSFETRRLLALEQRANTLLQEEVKERKRAAQALKENQIELRQAKDAAEAANHAKSAFLTNMSHELRTPLNAILGFAQILVQSKELPAGTKPKIQNIQNAGEHLLSLINDILDLSKVEAGRIELFPEPIDMAGFFEDIVEMIRFRTEQKFLAFEYHVDASLPTAIHIDPKRLRQVVLNLLGNAAKFTEHGKVALHVTYDNGVLRLIVEDTGIGIAADQLEQIFQPFVQSGESRYKSQGTGLGLSITHKIVTLMDGEIKVTSELGKGTRFEVDIPVTAVDASLPLEEILHLDLEHMTGYRRTDGNESPLRLLIVDDVANNREVLREMLQMLGFDIMEADSGEACLQSVPEFQPDIVLLDMRMPGLNGLETMRALHICSEFRTLPVIIVSATVHGEDRQAAMEEGCLAYLPKPLEEVRLLHELGKHLPLVWEYERVDVVVPVEIHYPTTWLAQLEQAVSDGDSKTIQALLEERQHQDGGVGTNLQAWVKNYEYEEILEWIGKLRDTDR